MMTLEEIKIKLMNSHQMHLLSSWDNLTQKERNEFLTQLTSINFECVNELYQKALNCLSNSDSVINLEDRMKSIPQSQSESAVLCTPQKLDAYWRRGLEEISKASVGIILLAGGQGTRLGVPYPKGMYSVGLPSGKTLLQIQAERIRRVQEMSQLFGKIKNIIPWYIMTSESTKISTEIYLKDNNYFGLKSENVIVFEQGSLPCFDLEGKILLDVQNRVALSPDGNGGIYGALSKNGILADMEKRGITYVHIHSVDNILIKEADPVFIGYCVDKNADCGAKVIKKSDPDEALGVICSVDNQVRVVEYSEITKNTANLRDTDGSLLFSVGNICNHFCKTEFLRLISEKYEDKLKLHVVKKKMPYINASGVKIIPLESNCIKIEKFIFDAFRYSSNFVVWEVSRESEFSPVKNNDTKEKDCPSTARNDLYVLHKRYVEAAGGTVVGDVIEISSLLSYAGEDLSSKVQGKTLYSPVTLLSDIEMNNCEKH